MCAQLDLQVICKGPLKEQTPSNSNEFWNKELHFEKEKKRKKENFDV